MPTPLFMKGRKKTGGRAKGTPNKATVYANKTAEDLCKAILAGCTDEFLEDLRQNNVALYVSLVRAVLSRNIKLSGDPENGIPIKVVIHAGNE